jgi:hypothetical protein
MGKLEGQKRMRNSEARWMKDKGRMGGEGANLNLKQFYKKGMSEANTIVRPSSIVLRHSKGGNNQ